MTGRTYDITVDGLAVAVTRKRIKHFYLKVHRVDGRVRVSAPLRMSEASVRSLVASRLEWIRGRLKRLQGRAPEAPPGFESGERHCFQGRSCELRVVERQARPRVRLDDDRTIELSVRPGTDARGRRALLESWYRARLRDALPGLIRRWEAVMGVDVAEWRIKRMRTRWGTCNTAARRIWLNLELAKKPPECLEYVVVHEMVHLLEGRHNARFYAYMDRFLPSWRERRERLGSSGPL